ncbi:transposase [Rhizobium leucaenae]|nr:transposase [Rhizobium leucaenae]
MNNPTLPEKADDHPYPATPLLGTSSAGRPPRDLSEPDWALVVRELKRKGVTLTLLWQEYRASHPDGYGFT